MRAWEAAAGGAAAARRGLRVKHDGTYNSGGYVRQGVTPTDDPRTRPGRFTRCVCAHPETGRRCLYLGRRRNAYIEGLPLEESDALLDEIWALRDARCADLAPPVAGRRPRAVGQPLHDAPPRRVRSGERGVMHRTQIKGKSRPVA